MGRFSLAVILLGATLAASACGDPIVVLGDTPGIMRIVLGVGDSIGTRVDSLGTRTKLTEPQAVAFTGDVGLTYVVDRGATRSVNGIQTRVSRIFAVDSRGRTRLTLDAGGCLIGTCMQNPVAMVYHEGMLYLADVAGHRVLRYVPGASSITTLAGTGTAGSSEDGAVAAQSPVNGPSGIAVLDDGRVLFSETNSGRVRIIGTDGRLGTLAGGGTSTDAGDGGPATAVHLVQPAGLATIDGTVYIAEFGGARVRAVSAGTISTVAGVGVAGYSGDGGAATDARVDRPFALTLSGSGRTLFISDQGNHRVRAVDMVTGTIRTYAGTGATAWAGSRLSAGQTTLSSPAGLDTGNGFLFIVDRGHSVVWRTSVDIQ